VVLSVLFAALLAVPVLLQQSGKGKPDAGDQKISELTPFGFHLEEVGQACGIVFAHEPPPLDPKISHIQAQIASVGASVSVADFDRDGWIDVYFTTSRPGAFNGLFRNMQDGRFENVAGKLGVGDVNQSGAGVSMGSVWADYDNDGFEDIFIYKWGKPVLFRNRAGMGFERVSDAAGLPGWVNANTAVWFDYDLDGYVDLFIGGYFRESLNLQALETTVIMPESYEYANNGGRNYLLRNRGDGTFEDVTFIAGLTSTRWTLAAGAVDLNGDGRPDLAVANDYAVDELYVNQGDGTFEEVGKKSGIGYRPKSGMNISFGDLDNRGILSFYVSNITESGVLLQGNNLWVPVLEKSGPGFRNEARERNVEMGGWSYCGQFGDLNNDGYQDLYVANGYISGIRGNSYWYDYSKITGGNKKIISDAANWPPMQGRSQSGYQQNMVWVNDGSGTFADVSDYFPTAEGLDSRAVALADLWNRGVLDVLVANQNNVPFVFRNSVDEKYHWIGFLLEGRASNRSAIGAEVQLFWQNHAQKQVVTGGIGFSAQNQRRVHFGLGETNMVDSVYIRWPSGIKTVLRQPKANHLHIIAEQ
jgi:hypothetical protein